MINHDIIDELSDRFDVEVHEASRLLNLFFSALVTELLSVGTLSVRGLGSFTVQHIPLKKQSTVSTITYSPPRTSLVFESRISGPDDAKRIAASYLFISRPDDASRFSRILGTIFTQAVQQQKEIYIKGFGRFSLKNGNYVFLIEPSLADLLNREYQDLKEVVLPQSKPEHGNKERKIFRYVLSFSAIVLTVVLCTVFYGWFSENMFFPSTIRPSRSSATEVVHAKNATIGEQSISASYSHELSERRGVIADSIVLVKGDYVIVLATFQTERTASNELVPLRSAGIVAFIWPAFVNGMKYYRLMTGKFLTRTAALEKLKKMPEKTAVNAYIQKVKKTVVLHGKKGL